MSDVVFAPGDLVYADPGLTKEASAWGLGIVVSASKLDRVIEHQSVFVVWSGTNAPRQICVANSAWLGLIE